MLDQLHIWVWCSIPPKGLLQPRWIQLLFRTHFFRGHKGALHTKRNDLHQLVRRALIHTEKHVKSEIGQESLARSSTRTVSWEFRGVGATQKQSQGDKRPWNKRFISVETDHRRITVTHTLPFNLFFFKIQQWENDSVENSRISSHFKFVCTCNHRWFPYRW